MRNFKELSRELSEYIEDRCWIEVSLVDCKIRNRVVSNFTDSAIKTDNTITIYKELKSITEVG